MENSYVICGNDMSRVGKKPIQVPPGVQVEIEGSKGIRYQLTSQQRDSVLQTGQVVLHPNPIFKQGYVSALVRIEAVKEPQLGYSYDVKLGNASTFTLIDTKEIVLTF